MTGKCRTSNDKSSKLKRKQVTSLYTTNRLKHNNLWKRRNRFLSRMTIKILQHFQNFRFQCKFRIPFVLIIYRGIIFVRSTTELIFKAAKKPETTTSDCFSTKIYIRKSKNTVQSNISKELGIYFIKNYSL